MPLRQNWIPAFAGMTNDVSRDVRIRPSCGRYWITVTCRIMDDLSLALKLYLGRPASPFPRARSDEVRQHFDDHMAEKISALINEVGTLDTDWKAHSLVTATKWAEAEMRHRHPDLTDEAITDLGWAFSYSNK